MSSVTFRNQAKLCASSLALFLANNLIARQRTGRVMNLFLEVKRSPVFHGQVAK